ncbi:Heavy metal RND efflux outer membrane protein, CzcC family [Labilithrix luteola]|uniref:Heavy metal RND efflux outer membrane protein, CzcC family n=1 Tax=Labilithrix luteola TaxID=1391654 RepID=A0A0K1PTG9_9BACT|nr:TolC family protein [Labilithrix luteola]AKU96429.1 Heavy metal RND efflux outer membrane protein, CzcC family [Labilithrix luteola]
MAADVVPPATELPHTLTLEDALGIFRRRGLDLLIADANTRGAEGAVKIAGAVANPVVSASVGNAFTYSTNKYSHDNCLESGAECSPWSYNLGISDSAALADALSGKRDLRLKVARNALAAAKMARVDAERTIAFQVKATYIQTAQATLAFKFAKDVAETQATSLKRSQDRYKGGAINEGDLQRIEVQKLEADQAVDEAELALRAARVALAFLLGVRGDVADFDVETKVLDYVVPGQLRDATGVALLRTAFDHRPDLIGLGYLKQQAEAQIQLVKRQKLPDITLGANYAWGGGGGYGGTSTNGPLTPQTLTFSISAPLPVFYGLQGEQRQAEAQYDTNALQQAKVTSQVVNEVATAFASFAVTKRIVERMEGPRRAGGGLLQSARGAFEIVATQYEKGAASLTDYLDALRTYIATKNEYFDALSSYWTAVFQLEAAVARDLR